MAIQYLPQQGIAGSLGSALGQGLGAGLQQLAQQRVNNMLKQQQQQEVAQGLQALQFSPEKAQQLSLLPTPLLQDYLKLQQQERTQQALASLLGSMEQPVAAQPTAPTASPEQLTQAALSDFMASGVKDSSALSQLFAKQDPLFAPVQQETADTLDVSTKPGTPIVSPAKLQAKLIGAGVDPRVAAEVVKTQLAQQKEVREARKEELERKKEARREREEAFKQTKDERKKWADEYKVAKQDFDTAKTLEELNQSGKLSTSGYNEFLSRSGLDLGALESPESIQFKSLAQTFMRGAKQYFGGNVSNREIELFLKTIPNLSQTPEGRKRILAGIKNMSRAKMAYFEEARKVIKQNKNIPPLDLLEQVEDRVEARAKKFAELFKRDIAKPVPEAQKPLVTALQAGAGSLIGMAPKALPLAGAALIGGGTGGLGGLGALGLGLGASRLFGGD